MKKYILAMLVVGLPLFGAAGVANASVLTFDTNPDLATDGAALGGELYWGDVGGGHAYVGDYTDGGWVDFASPTHLNDFQLNGLPEEGFAPQPFQNMVIGDVEIRALDSSLAVIWSTTVDLSGYDSWDNWLTVSAEVAGVSRLQIMPTGTFTSGGFWPSLDNVRINESSAAVSEPVSILLLGLGLAGLAGTSRRRKNS